MTHTHDLCEKLEDAAKWLDDEAVDCFEEGQQRRGSLNQSQAALIRQAISLLRHEEMEDEAPYGYVVVNDQGYFVGIWGDEKIAKDICAKGQPSHHQQVVPVKTTLKVIKEITQ